MSSPPKPLSTIVPPAVPPPTEAAPSAPSTSAGAPAPPTTTTTKAPSQLPSKPNEDAGAIKAALDKLGGLTRRSSLTSQAGAAFTPISGGSRVTSGKASAVSSRASSKASSTVASPTLLPQTRGDAAVLSLSPPGMRGSLTSVMEHHGDGEELEDLPPPGLGLGENVLGPSTGSSPAGPSRPGGILSRMSSASSTGVSMGAIEAPSDILERSRPATPSGALLNANNPWASINVIDATPHGTPTSESKPTLAKSSSGTTTPSPMTPSSNQSTLGRASSLRHFAKPRQPSHSHSSSASNAPSSSSSSPTASLAAPNLTGARTTTSGSPLPAQGGLSASAGGQALKASALGGALAAAAEAEGGMAPSVLGEQTSSAGYVDDLEGTLTPEEARARSAPSTPHFGAQTDMLRTLDESTRVIRQSSKINTRAPSVSGIGGLVEKPDYSEAKIVVAMVGLPARGKSYLSNKLMRYLRWLEYKVEVFNVGQLRRSKARDAAQAGKGQADHSASYFSSTNEKANESREQLANESLESLITWLKLEGNVGIHDATNSTHSRRAKIQARVAQEPGLQLIFLESLCDDPAVIATNIALKVSSGDPDYKNMSKEDAERDFRKRIEQYERVYETITESKLSYCKILNVGRQVTINRVNSYLQSRIAFYLMNLHLKPRSIYLSRHGESMHNVGGMIGGDSPLSPRGERYAAALPALVLDNIGVAPLTVWTSTLQRTIATGRFLPYPKKTWKSLDELDAGVCDGMTYEEIAERYPEDYESRDEDKFNYRYRGGESYRDVVVRLEPVIMELERQENILIICHQAVIRCLYAYFMALPQQELPYIKVPLHTLIKLTPMAYGCHEERYPLPIAAVDTHRPKPVRKSAVTSPDVSTPPNFASPPPVSSGSNTGRDYFGSNLTKGLVQASIKEEDGHDDQVDTVLAPPEDLVSPKTAEDKKAEVDTKA